LIEEPILTDQKETLVKPKRLLGLLFCSLIATGVAVEALGQPSFTLKPGFIVRGADEMKVNQSVKRGAETDWTPQETTVLSLSFHGLIGKSRLEPSTEVPGCAHRSADVPGSIFLGEATQQNPSPSPSPSTQTAEQKAAREKRLAERRVEMEKRSAERKANAEKRKAEFAKHAEERKAKNAQRSEERKAAFAKRTAEQKERTERQKEARQARAAKQSADRQAAAEKRAAEAEKRSTLADGTFRFLSSRMSAHSTRVVKGAPYSAVAVTEFVQKFVDGNQIVRRNEAAYYRDSEGRTRFEQKLNTIGKWSASGEPPRIITIGDPVAGAYYNLDPRTRTAMKNTELGKRLQQQSLNQAREAADEKIKQKPPAPPKTDRETALKVSADGRKRTESLGTQRIEGVEAEGKRVTTTIPAGEIGNTLPIEITDESWFSPELQALVMTKHHDPRSGDTIYRLTNITRREPDHSLFEVPPDYTIVDRSGPKTPPKIPATPPKIPTPPPKIKTEKKESKSQIFD
jgi:hypothetical protein